MKHKHQKRNIITAQKTEWDLHWIVTGTRLSLFYTLQNMLEGKWKKWFMCIKHFISQQLNRKSNALLAVHFNKTFTFNRLHWTKAVHAKSETWPQLNIHASLSSCWWCHDIYSQHNWSDFPAAAIRARHQCFLSENTHKTWTLLRLWFKYVTAFYLS